MASSPGGHRDDLCSPGGVTGQDAVVEHRVPAWRGHQGGQPLEELAGAQHHASGPVRPGPLEAQDDITLTVPLQALSSERWTCQVATDSLESLPVRRRHDDTGVQVEAIDGGTARREPDYPTPETLDSSGSAPRPGPECSHPGRRCCLETELEVVRVRFFQVPHTLSDEPVGSPYSDPLDDGGDLCGGGGRGLVEAQLAGLEHPGVAAVQHEHVEVGVQPQVSPEALHHSDGSGASSQGLTAGPVPAAVEALDDPKGDAEHPSRQVMAVGEQETQIPGQGENPLPDWYAGQHLFHHPGCEGSHAPATARRAETPALAGERHQAMMVAGPALEPRKSTGRVAADKEVLELASDVPRQAAAL